ncbi:hypothetical protein [Bacillus sp. 3255]|uniref:hypothetical protein n=1 Tax=Bacillus sp. 3255 TaxID=2817904 RepID=UPI00285F1D5E|nr:hypothetical protein [Bacillus sp. 3255]MDR6882332.1 quinol-cytochrome oxidoreductase complex cytochrome b subunit [Bacillus sp. 3255]
MARTFFKSIVFACLFLVVYYIIKMAWGYYMVMKYTPDIVQAYSASEHLSSKVSFGVSASTSEMLIESASILVLGVAIYMLCSYFLHKIRSI